MLKKIFFAIAFLGGAMLFAQDGVLKIEITNNLDEEVDFANVVVESGGIIAGSGIADENGKLVIKNLSPGEYNVKTMRTGYPNDLLNGVLVKNNQTTYLEIKLEVNSKKEIIVREYVKDLIPPDYTVRTTFTDEDMKVSVFKDPKDFLVLVPTAVQTREGMTPHFKGARDGVIYVVDGQTMASSFELPHSAIKQMSVILGGIPAQYGDLTGAVVEIETKSGLVNPNRKK